MKIPISNVGFDLYQSQYTLIGSNALDVLIGKQKLEFPMVSPHQSELKKSKLAKIPLKSSLMQYVHVPKRNNNITEQAGIKLELGQNKIEKLLKLVQL